MVEEEVHEAGACNFSAVEEGTFQMQFLENEISDLTRRHFESLSADHSGICGEVAVGLVSGDLDIERRKSIGRGDTLCNEDSESVHDDLTQLRRSVFDEV